MEQREQLIRRWFAMWLQGDAHDIDEIFAPDCIYTESWGPEYHGVCQIAHWFDEWNTRGRVLRWDIQRFFHSGSCTVVQWYFKNQMYSGAAEEFDGLSLVRWTNAGQIAALKEYGCNIRTYDPYAHGPAPCFRPEAPRWF